MIGIQHKKRAHCYCNNNKPLESPIPDWVIPYLQLYYNTAILPYQVDLLFEKCIQKQDVINALLAEYKDKTPIHQAGLELLYTRAENRGYHPKMIYIGLKTLICKNYVRSKYVFPNNDPLQEIIHERVYMEDREFRNIFKMKEDEFMKINGVDYRIEGYVYSKLLDREVPLLGIKMMSDEKWKELTNTPEQIERRKQKSHLLEAFTSKEGERHG